MPELSPIQDQQNVQYSPDKRVIFNSNGIPPEQMTPDIVFDDSALRKYASQGYIESSHQQQLNILGDVAQQMHENDHNSDGIRVFKHH